MDDKDLVILTETVERSKSNTKQIQEIKEKIKDEFAEVNNDIKDLRQENKAIYELSSGIKLIVQDMSLIKDSVNKVEEGQKELTVKMDTQIKDVKQQIEMVDSKSKVDIIQLLITRGIPFLIGGGLVYWITQIMNK